MLIDAEANVNATDSRGRTVLMQIVEQIEQEGDSVRRAILEETREILIKEGADESVK